MTSELQKCGGVLSLAQLHSLGFDTECRSWSSPRRGWYAAPGADAAVVAAVAAGGCLACCSVLKRFGVWIPDNDLHVRYSRALRGSKKSCDPGLPLPVKASVGPLHIALASALNCLDAESAVVVLDSLLNKRMVEMADVRGFLGASRHAWRSLADRCDRCAESGTESMTRYRLQSRQIQLRSQVQIGDVGRVDFLIGKRLIIECDGEEYHRNKFEEDRERDRRLAAVGFHVIRLTYKQVRFGWPAVEQDILAIIRRREHERVPEICV